MECEGTEPWFLDKQTSNHRGFLNIGLTLLKNLLAEELVSFDDVSLVTSLLQGFKPSSSFLLLRHHNLHPISIPSGLFG